MLILQTNITSYSGNFIYSDRSWSIDPKPKTTDFELKVHKTTLLNQVACMPCFSLFSSIVRIVAAVFHTLAHLTLAAIYRNKEHCYHALKGCCTILEGLIEMTPIAGLVYVWKTSPPSGPDSLKKQAPLHEHIFLVKIDPFADP